MVAAGGLSDTDLTGGSVAELFAQNAFIEAVAGIKQHPHRNGLVGYHLDAADVAGLIVVGDDISTGDMAPDGMGMSLWSNIPECARYLFRRQDPGFHDRAQDWGGGFVVGGHNYGQGSSREQAALSALYLGVRAIVANSFARIHRGNLIAQGILPLSFAAEADYDRVRQGEEWTIDGARAAVSNGATELVARGDTGRRIHLELALQPRERQILLAGGTLRYLAGHAG